jgi:ribose transport system ATP-binding protein
MAPLLEMKGISKAFPGVQALRDVDFDLAPGEVHALVGENGAGKSTLMKVLAGVHQADSGDILLQGEKIVPDGPRSMLDAGVSVIYQELNLIPYLSLAENVFLGKQPTTAAGTIDWARMNREFEALLEPFEIKLNPRALVRSIGPAYQQVVEIVKALSAQSGILVMDEPTAPLTGKEVDHLFSIIRQLRDSGVSIIYISHRLEEILEVADRVTVLRDGERIATRPLKDLTIPEIIRDMVGRELKEQYPSADITIGDEALRVEGLSRDGLCEDVSFSVKKGEIVGFAGLVGAGRTEIMELLFGRRKKDSGTVFLKGKQVEIRSTRDAVRNGLALIPEERKRQGLVLGLSIFDNTALTVLDRFSRFGYVSPKAIGTVIREIVANIGVKTPSIRQLVKNLSGGNQQKVVLAKWFIRESDIYIFDEPTRGIDVGAKVEIYKLMQALAERGAAIIMVSSELPEVMSMSDRIIVIHRGRVAGEFLKGEADEEEIMRHAFGVAESAS